MNNTSPLLRSAVIAMAMLTSGGTDATTAAAVGREHEHLTHITTSLDRYREPLLTLLAGLLRGGDGSTDGASLASAVLEVSSGLGLPTLTGAEQRGRYARMHGAGENTVPPLPERANDAMSPEERRVFHSSQAAEAAPLGPALREWVAEGIPYKDVVGGAPSPALPACVCAAVCVAPALRVLSVSVLSVLSVSRAHCAVGGLQGCRRSTRLGASSPTTAMSSTPYPPACTSYTAAPSPRTTTRSSRPW